MATIKIAWEISDYGQGLGALIMLSSIRMIIPLRMIAVTMN
jgi:hypothetical protein